MVPVAIGLAAVAAVMLVAALVTRIIPLIFVSIACSFAASMTLRFYLFKRRKDRS